MTTFRLPLASALLAIVSACSAAPVAPFRVTADAGGVAADRPAAPAVTSAPDGSTGDSLAEGLGQCGASVVTANAAPSAADVMFVVDRSGIMLRKLPDGGTQWDALRTGLGQLAKAVSTPQTRLGMSFFPMGDAPVACCAIDAKNEAVCSCAVADLPAEAARCTASNYAKPALSLELAGGGHEQRVQAAMPTMTAFLYGPSPPPAMASAYEILRRGRSDARKAVVLVNGDYRYFCQPQNAVSLAKAASLAAEPIKTYVIGIGNYANDKKLFSEVALAGGTQRAPGCAGPGDCHMAVSLSTFSADLALAAKRIQREMVACSFDVPTESLPKGWAQGQANVTVDTEGLRTVVPRDTQRREGWDVVDEGTRIQLFGGACERADATTKVAVVHGCETRTAVP